TAGRVAGHGGIHPVRRAYGVAMRTTGALERLRRRWGVRASAAMSAAVLVAVAVVGAGVALVLLQDRAVRATVEEQVRAYASSVAERLRAGDLPADVVSRRSGEFAVAQVLDGAGRVLAASPQIVGDPALSPDPLSVPSGSGVVEQPVAPADADSLLVVEIMTTTPAGPRYVLAASSLAAADRSTDAATHLVLVGLPVLALVAAAITYALSGRALRPVEGIRARVAALTDRDLSSRVPEPFAHDEVGKLARTMNDMLGRLEAAQRRQRRFVADASHELRSPLATIVARLELGQRRGPTPADVSAMVPEARRMTRLIDDLLLLARADERGLNRRRGDVDLDELMEAEAAHLRAGGVTVRCEIRPVRVRGDHGQLTRALRNLADNAARHARAVVTLRLGEDLGHAVIKVADDGPGIPEGDRRRVFERFVRLDDDRARASGGVGLGLAIVAEIVAAHDGTALALEPEVAGALIEIRLPLQGCAVRE
ncbi:MAG: HAMP domain-containing histidine kinase, partial [Actinomycetota bacterium]|nr:HAMP domain-containing histidine kinase [Actinomycetota bacterium]